MRMTERSIYTIAPETNGFMRATMRGLVRERKRSGIGDATPFLLTRWDDGRMSLEDTTTGRRVPLEAFGQTNAGAFAHLFFVSGGRPMNLLPPLRRYSFEAPCTVEIERSAESLHAHVVMDGDVRDSAGRRGPGARSATEPPFGERIAVRRTGDHHPRRAPGATVDAPCRQFRAHRAL